MTSKIDSVTVYCSSSNLVDNKFTKEIKRVGKLLAQHKIKLVYGGGRAGLMGAISNSVMKNGGKVEGIITQHLVDIENINKDITNLKIVNTMHERKKELFNRSQAYIVFPGGIGTLEEFFEVLSWKQLKLHNKRIAIYNFNNYWDQLNQLIEHTINLKFAGENMKEAYKVVDNIDELRKFLEINEEN